MVEEPGDKKQGAPQKKLRVETEDRADHNVLFVTAHLRRGMLVCS